MSNQATSVRGRRALYPYGDVHRSVTDLLSDPAVSNFVTRGTQMTPGSQRNRIRNLLRRGEVTPETVTAYATTHPPPGLPTEPRLYGAQRRRAGLPRLTARRDILYGPERRPPVPRPRGPSAREILARNPDIRAFLQPNRMLKPKSLQAKFRKLHRTGRIPEHVLNPPPHQPAQAPVFQLPGTTRKTYREFKSRNHDITTNEVSKIALSAMDNKRIIIPDDPEGRTWAIGHWRNRPQGGLRNGEERNGED